MRSSRGFTSPEAQARAEAKRAELPAKARQNAMLAVEQYTKILQRYPGFERTEEVLVLRMGNKEPTRGVDLKRRQRAAGAVATHRQVAQRGGDGGNEIAPEPGQSHGPVSAASSTGPTPCAPSSTGLTCGFNDLPETP